MLDYTPPVQMIRDLRVCEPTALRLYGYLRSNPRTTYRAASIALDVTEQTVRDWINRLVKLGYVHMLQRGNGRGTMSHFGFPLENELHELAS